MKPLPFIMQYVRRYKYRYIAGILTLFAVDAASVFIPKLTGIITDGLTARSITWSSIRTCLLGIFLIGLLLAVGRFCGVIFFLEPHVLSSANCVMKCFPIWKLWMWNTTTATKQVI